MALATYKDMCIDATDPEKISRFWSAVLGLSLDFRGDDPTPLTGPTKEHSVWVNPVPEPKTVKHRVHIDVNTASVEDIVALGGRVIDVESFPWTVMADPEGGEFCAFVREGEIGPRLYELVVDSAEPHEIAAWWGEVLDVTASDSERGFSYLEGLPGAPFEALVFVPVPEAKAAKNRIHIDMTTPDVDALVAAGATVVRAPDEEIDWHVLADPEGNEFCAFLHAEV